MRARASRPHRVGAGAVLLALVLVAPGAVGQDPPPAVRQAFEMARSGGRFAEAEFRRLVIEHFGPHPDALPGLERLVLELEAGTEAAPATRGRMRYALGLLLVRQGRFEEALPHLQRAIDQAPDLLGARLEMAESLARLGRLAETHRFLEAALAAAGEDAPARARVLTAAAGLEQRYGEPVNAARGYEAALAEDPGHLPARVGLAGVLAQLGHYHAAAAAYGDAVVQAPQDPVVRLGQASALILAGAHADARRRLEEGVAALPDSLDLKDLLARHLASCPDRAVRDGERAVALAEELARTVPTAESIETLAMAYAEAGRFAEAAARQRGLLARFGPQADPSARARWEANLARYVAGQSCCAGESVSALPRP